MRSKLESTTAALIFAVCATCLAPTIATAADPLVVAHPLTKDEVVVDTGGTLGHAAFRMCGYDKGTPIVILMPDTSACPTSLDLTTTVEDVAAAPATPPATWDFMKDVATSE